VLDAERRVLADIKALALGLLRESSAAYGDQLRDAQEVLGHIADIVIETYAIESASARAEKLAGRGAPAAATALDSVRVYVADAIDRVVHHAKPVLQALGATRSAPLGPLVAPLRNHDGLDTIAVRRRIADAVIAAGRHPL
jgi:hypothetical protein